MVVTYGQTLKDTNGNFISKVVMSSTETDWKDTLGRIALKIITGASSIQYQFLDVNGGYQPATLNLGSFNIKTNFGCSGIVEYTGTASLPTSLVLPNGQSYSFTYEPTPGFPGSYTGRVKQVTLPTGGTYVYEYLGANDSINCADGTVTNLKRTISDGTSPAAWQFTRVQNGTNWDTTITDPVLPYDAGVANQSVYKFNGLQEISAKFYQGAATGSPLRTVNATWATNGTPASKTVILENNQQSKTETDFDTNGNLLALREYDWGSGVPGGLVRTTALTYLNTSAYTSRNILNRVTQKVVKDSPGTIKFRQDFAYDGASSFTGANCISGAMQHDDLNYGCSFLTRGNPISLTTYMDPITPSGALTTSLTYDSLGNLRSVSDPGSHTTALGYSDSWGNATTCAPTGGAFAYLTSSTNALGQLTSATYNSCTGTIASTTDANGRTTSFVYDLLERLTQQKFGDGGQVTLVYDDTSRTITATQKRTETDTVQVTDVYSQLGLLVQRQLPGARKVDIIYDALGRVWKVSNPYVNAGEATAGVVETQFDALGRVKTTLNQDLTSVQFQYASNATQITDEAGKRRLTETDPLGRVTKVCEVTGGNTRSPAQSCGITWLGGTGYLTSNTYDVFDHATQVAQGSQTRISNFDALGRLASAKIIEVSTTVNLAYGYDSDSNLTSVSDPRGTVNYEYDALHRPIRKKHGTTIVAEYTYDGTATNNAVGRLITDTDGPVGTADKTDYTYDAMGRVKSANRTVSGTPYAMSYAYDLLGNPTSLTYPSGRVVEYAYSSTTGELNKVTDGTNSLAKYDYVTGTVYSALGPPAQVNFGNAVRTTLGWSKRGLATSILTEKQPQPPGPAYFNLSYTYFANGQIQQITNGLDSLKSEIFTYDDLGRLLTAQLPPSGTILRTYQYDYDRFGNRWAQTVTAGSGYNGSLSLDTTSNRITSPNFTYDGSGNLINAGAGTSFAYNPENFMTTASSTSYNVDTQGRRVRKTAGGVTTDYFYSGSVVIAEKQGSTWTDYVFFGDQRIAKQTGSTLPAATFLHTDHLGSTRVCTDANGNSTGTCDYEPFGEFQNVTTCSALPTNYRFAGMEWDADAGPNGLYHTWFRYYDPTQGRWMGVDPLAGSPDNPQSLNRYAYVLDDPVNLIDPAGLCALLCWESGGGESRSVECVLLCGGGGPVAPACDRNQTRDASGLPPCPSGGGDRSRDGDKPPKKQGTPRCGPAPTGLGIVALVQAYLRALGSVESMFGQFLTGTGSSDLTFGPGSVQSQMMASSPGVTQAVSNYLSTGKPTGLYTFGLSGLVNAGANPIQQFVGSYTYTVTPANGGLNVTLSNYTSVKSGSYHVLPSHQRSSFKPLGTTHQTYQVFVPCHK